MTNEEIKKAKLELLDEIFVVIDDRIKKYFRKREYATIHERKANWSKAIQNLVSLKEELAAKRREIEEG